MKMIVIPFGIIFIIVGAIVAAVQRRADRKAELEHIRARLAEIERRKAAEANGEVEPRKPMPRRYAGRRRSR